MPKLPIVKEENPNYRKAVGEAIYGFVRQLVQRSAPRTTGLMIDLPVPEIQKYMGDFDFFRNRVSQVSEIVEQQTAI